MLDRRKRAPARVGRPVPFGDMTSQGTPCGRFTCACKAGNVHAAEIAMREMGQPSLLLALDYLELLGRARPEKLELAALRWHARFESETIVTLAESQLALAALTSLCAGHAEAIGILEHLLRRARPTLVRRHP